MLHVFNVFSVHCHHLWCIVTVCMLYVKVFAIQPYVQHLR